MEEENRGERKGIGREGRKREWKIEVERKASGREGMK